MQEKLGPIHPTDARQPSERRVCTGTPRRQVSEANSLVMGLGPVCLHHLLASKPRGGVPLEQLLTSLISVSESSRLDWPSAMRSFNQKAAMHSLERKAQESGKELEEQFSAFDVKWMPTKEGGADLRWAETRVLKADTRQKWALQTQKTLYF